ncbi:MAG: methylated-DNA--[protein]-cysteine S-methyltransferase [Desulfofustis sp.]|jgi:methylated-DNA-[protein]-cysteine S-methyltransferase|nr:methylated-DNA--[protein]-cysteine S-methyltransferase [Desulfofustis sp.]
MKINSAIHTTVIDTMIGPLSVSGDHDWIYTIEFAGRSHPAECDEAASPAVRKAVAQLRNYFSGTLRSFELPILLSGTDFQMKVWQFMQTIEFGQVITYGAIARRLGNVRLARAVGQAANRNPIPIVVPCHRVVGANGALVGYDGGIWIKRLLLEHERRVSGT